jgi:hypothetical protein
MSSLSLLASLLADTTRDDPFSRPEIIWGTLGLTAALLVGAAVIYSVDKWRKKAAEGSRDDTESLTSFRAMYEAGEITEAEYAELKRKLAEKVKKAPGGSAGGPQPPPGERPPPRPPEPPAPPAGPTEPPPSPSTA